MYGGTRRKEKSGEKFSEADECRQTGANTVIQGQQCVRTQAVGQGPPLPALTLKEQPCLAGNLSVEQQ